MSHTQALPALSVERTNNPEYKAVY